MNFENTKNNILKLLQEYPNKYFKLHIIYKKYINKYNILFNINNLDKCFFDLYFLNVIRIIFPNQNNIQIKTSKYFISHISYTNDNIYEQDDLDSDNESNISISSIDSDEDDEEDNIYKINYQFKNINKKLINFIIDNNLLDFIYLIDYKNNNILHYLISNNDSFRFSKMIELLPLNYLIHENNKKIIPMDYIDDNSFLKNIIYKKIIDKIDKIDVIEDNHNENNQKINYSILNLNSNLFFYSFISFSLFIYLYSKQT